MITRRVDVKRVVVRLFEWEILGIDVEFDVEIICLGKVSFTSNFKTLFFEFFVISFLNLSIFGLLALRMIDNPSSSLYII